MRVELDQSWNYECQTWTILASERRVWSISGLCVSSWSFLKLWSRTWPISRLWVSKLINLGFGFLHVALRSVRLSAEQILRASSLTNLGFVSVQLDELVSRLEFVYKMSRLRCTKPSQGQSSQTKYCMLVGICFGGWIPKKNGQSFKSESQGFTTVLQQILQKALRDPHFRKGQTCCCQPHELFERKCWWSSDLAKWPYGIRDMGTWLC